MPARTCREDNVAQEAQCSINIASSAGEERGRRRQTEAKTDGEKGKEQAKKREPDRAMCWEQETW